MMRTVRLLSRNGDQEADVGLHFFSDFYSHSSVVLLGDPGAGKTYLFKEAAKAVGAYFVRARDFLNIPAAHLRGRQLFIDGLDEKRAGRGDQDTIDLLVIKLFDVNPSKVCISCRTADWLGDSDLAALAPYFAIHGAAHVLHLEKLSQDEQISVLQAKGISINEASIFIDAAGKRGLGDFLDNPQNLLMLWRAVEGGTWPATRAELYEVSTGLMLSEANTERARSGVGVFTAAELRLVAGAICAARLISDVSAIGLSEREDIQDCPSYRSINLYSRESVQAALSRRVFDTAQGIEAVDYAHRTTAEYLAAGFLADRVRQGLPFGRVQALIGIDRQPASELRGLHAWLTVHLPEHANALINADPYGVLAYGDAASLPMTSCSSLVRALARLSEINPYFRPSGWDAPSIGALARHDMIDEFRLILNDFTAGFGVRSIVIDAIAHGTPLYELVPELKAILEKSGLTYTERKSAIDALLQLGDSGKSAICAAFNALLNDSADDLRLCTAIVHQLYGDPYGPGEVVALIHASLQIDSDLLSGNFWFLADSLPLVDIPAILDAITAPKDETIDFYSKTREARSFYARLVVRVWPICSSFEPARIISWLQKRFELKGSIGGGQASGLRAAMQASPELLKALAVDFFARVQADQDRWSALSHFRNITLHEIDNDTLTQVAFEAFKSAENGGGRRMFLYEVAIMLSMGTKIFDEVFARATGDAGLESVRDASVVSQLPKKYFAGQSGKINKIDNRSNQRKDFDGNIFRIRGGLHYGWLTHIARIYFALYGDVDRHLTPRARVSEWLGPERVDAALEGLVASLSQEDLPTFDNMLAVLAEHKYYNWWYALLAGLDEHWANAREIDLFTDDFIKAMLAFDIALPIWLPKGKTESIFIHPWRLAIATSRPDLMRDAYMAVARIALSRSASIANGLRELLTEPQLEPFRPSVVTELLCDFPGTEAFRLSELLEAAIRLPSTHRACLALSEEILAGRPAVGERQQDLWLATAYALAPEQFEGTIRQRAIARPGFVFDLRDISFVGSKDELNLSATLPVLEFIAQLTGSLHPDAPYPSSGFSGDTNPWDASDYFRKLVNAISVSPSVAATRALERLVTDPHLSSYKPQLLAVLDRQRQRRRDTEYDRPDWSQTLAALANHTPATVADLHAVLVAHLNDLAHLVAGSNTDIFKQFWNIDQYARPLAPRPEEACRDVLITLLRPVIQPLGITLEPEGHMAADKRADISASMPGRKILCELKRDYHADVWTAPTDQLEKFYVHDPEAKGFGIYIVFWFGSRRPQSLRPPPDGMTVPETLEDMKAIIGTLLPNDSADRLEVVLIDVSGSI